MILKLVRFLRALAWGFAAVVALQKANDTRYLLMHQDSAMQQSAAASIALCWLIAYLTTALAADRILELGERNLREQLSAR